MRSVIKLNNGSEHGGKTRFGMATGAQRAARTFTANMGESIGSIALRAYGANTSQNRAKILNANPSLNGQIVIPK